GDVHALDDRLRLEAAASAEEAVVRVRRARDDVLQIRNRQARDLLARNERARGRLVPVHNELLRLNHDLLPLDRPRDERYVQGRRPTGCDEYVLDHLRGVPHERDPHGIRGRVQPEDNVLALGVRGGALLRPDDDNGGPWDRSSGLRVGDGAGELGVLRGRYGRKRYQKERQDKPPVPP